MKLIYKDDNGKVFLGYKFEHDLNKIFSTYKLVNKKVLLVTGLKSFFVSEYFKIFIKTLKQNNIVVIDHFKISQNPNQLDVLKKIKNVKNKFDFIVAVGGGSVIDAAKLCKHSCRDNIKFLALYTVPGSATIVSPFAIFNNQEFKIGIKDENFIPDCSYILKAIFNEISLEKKIIAIADIFAHAIESLYSKSASDESRENAKNCLKILTSNNILSLPASLLIKADLLAGLSERVGFVLFPHAAGHYLTYKFGICHSIATTYFLDNYLKLLIKKGVKIPLSYIEYSEKIKNLMIKNKLMEDVNLSDNEVNQLFILTHKYMNFAYQNSPRKINKREYKLILKFNVDQ